jgi:ATP-binding cassette, subfamily B, bacterial MsbA
MKLLRRLNWAKDHVPSDMFVLVRRVIADQGTKHWPAYAAAYALMAIAAGCTAAWAYILGHAVNLMYSGGLWTILAICLTIVAISVVKGFAAYGQAVMLARINLTIASEYKILLFERVLRENLNYFSGKHSSEINGTINFAGNSVGNTLTTLVVATGGNLLTLVSLLAVMVIQSPVASVACCIFLPIGAFTAKRIRDRVRRLTEQQLAQSNGIFETAQETLRGLTVVKAFRLEDYVSHRFRDGVETMQTGSMKIVRASNRPGPLLESLGGIAVALLLMYGSSRVLVAGDPPGEILSFVTAFLLAYEPLKGLTRVQINLASSLVGVRALYELLDAVETEPDDSHLPTLSVGKGDIEFRDVAFSYRPGEPVLRKLSLDAEGGRTTALVGSSGGGKSTIFSLLLRLYEADSGTVFIDGQDISKVSRASVRQQIAYVGQDTFLFRGTIRENVLVGKPNATEDEMRAASIGAFAHDFICKFPMGYDTPVGEHGVQLSTGQRQRIAIARALIKNAPIVLLDESTAALDSESEREVRDAIARICLDRTTLVIAHRLHTVVDADRILVVEGGTITECGCYEELTRRQGRFAELSNLQFQGEAA